MSNINPPHNRGTFSFDQLKATFNGQTDLPYRYNAGAVLVFLQGSLLSPPDVDVTSGTKIVIPSGVSVTDEVTVLNIAAMTATLTGDGLPIGSVLWYTSNAAPPAGYMWLSKATLKKSDYSALYGVLGDVFNDGSQAASEFMLPDADDYFLRNFKEGSGRAFGSKQAESIGPHSHNEDTFNDGLAGEVGANGVNNKISDYSNFGKVFGSPVNVANKSYSRLDPTQPFTGGVNGLKTAKDGAGIGVETRPANIALNLIIKVTSGFTGVSLMDVSDYAMNKSDFMRKSDNAGFQYKNSGIIPLAADTILTANFGGCYRVDVPNIKVTLPPLADNVYGKTLTIINGRCTLLPSGSDTIWSDGQARSSFYLTPGQSTTWSCNSTNGWYITSGLVTNSIYGTDTDMHGILTPSVFNQVGYANSYSTAVLPKLDNIGTYKGQTLVVNGGSRGCNLVPAAGDTFAGGLNAYGASPLTVPPGRTIELKANTGQQWYQSGGSYQPYDASVQTSVQWYQDISNPLPFRAIEMPTAGVGNPVWFIEYRVAGTTPGSAYGGVFSIVYSAGTVIATTKVSAGYAPTLAFYRDPVTNTTYLIHHPNRGGSCFVEARITGAMGYLYAAPQVALANIDAAWVLIQSVV